MAGAVYYRGDPYVNSTTSCLIPLHHLFHYFIVCFFSKFKHTHTHTHTHTLPSIMLQITAPLHCINIHYLVDCNTESCEGNCVAPDFDGVDKVQLSNMLVWCRKWLPLGYPFVWEHGVDRVVDVAQVNTSCDKRLMKVMKMSQVCTILWYLLKTQQYTIIHAPKYYTVLNRIPS